MRERLNLWLPLQQYTNPVQRQRALGTYVIAALLLIGTVPALLPVVLVNLYRINAFILINVTVIGVVNWLAALAAISLTRSGQQGLGGAFVIGAWFISTTVALFAIQKPIDGSSILVVIMMLFGVSLTALISTRRIFWLSAVAVIMGTIIFGIRLRVEDMSNPWPVLVAFCSVVLAGVMGHIGVNWLLLRALHQSVDRASTTSARRLSLVEASSGVIERMLTRTDLNALLEETVGLIRQNFDAIDSARIWLIDADKRSATLSAWGGGSIPTEQKLGVGSLNAVGRVAIAGEHMLVLDTPEEQSHRRSSLPAGIRSQLVLPLKIASEIIGVLDVQSTQLYAFDQQDIEILQTLANQIAIAIDNARLYSSAQNSLAENKRLYEQTRASLREIERLNQQLTGQAWSEYLRARPTTIAATQDFVTNALDTYADWTPAHDEAARLRTVVIQNTPQSRVLVFPIMVRGQFVGVMEFELDLDNVLGGDQIAAIQQVIERMALSAENTRLFDEAQRIAQREAMVNEITERMQGTTSVESTIAAAAQGLAGVLKTARVAIRIGQMTGVENPEKS